MPLVADVCSYLDRFAPPGHAADWDNVGLLVGDSSKPADRIMTCLTITPDVVSEAVDERVEMFVTHHPVLFRGAKRLTSTSSEGRLLLPLIQANIAVYSPHTAFDNCRGGINDGLCSRLGLTNVTPLRKRDGKREFKLVVFVPTAELSKVSDAMFAAGAGHIGPYEQCSFRLPGVGTFLGTEGTNPTLGERGRREEVSEFRLEVVVPEGKVDVVISAMRSAHSYEEPAFDVYPLRPGPSGGDGRIGDLPEPVALGEIVQRMKVQLRSATMQFVGDPMKPVTRIGVACGAAGEFLKDALKAGADAFLTGEMRFHDLLTAEAEGVGVILPGHYASERPGVEDLAGRLNSAFPSLTVWPSRREHDPLQMV